MPEKLPFFPLQLVVYPGEALNLHIFEHRYRQLIQDAEEEGLTFGVPTVINKQVQPIATEVKLLEVSKRYASGETDVRTLGQRVFRIKNFEPVLTPKLYAGGEVEFLYVDEEEDYLLNERIVNLIRKIYVAMKIDKVVKSAHEGFRTFDIAHYCGFTLEQEYELLTTFDAKKRQLFLLNHLQSIRPDLTEDERNKSIVNRAQLNGHFKNLTPPNF